MSTPAISSEAFNAQVRRALLEVVVSSLLLSTLVNGLYPSWEGGSPGPHPAQRARVCVSSRNSEKNVMSCLLGTESGGCCLTPSRLGVWVTWKTEKQGSITGRRQGQHVWKGYISPDSLTGEGYLACPGLLPGPVSQEAKTGG